MKAKAKDCGCTGDDITLVSLVDFNSPGCRGTASVDALCERVATINNLAPERNCGLCIFPDLAKDSSLRGLFDEEKSIQESFFALKQHCDTRFVELFLGRYDGYFLIFPHSTFQTEIQSFKVCPYLPLATRPAIPLFPIEV